MTEKVIEEEFIRVCRLAQLVERKAKSPTYITKDGTEGIEYIAGKIRSFQVIGAGTVEAQKVYDQAVKDKQIAAVIGAFDDKPEPQKAEINAPIKAHEDVKDMGVIAPISPIVSNMAIQLPGQLTPALMSKWSQMSTTDRILMFQTTPKTEIYEVNVGKNPETGKAEMASYVKGNYMLKEANAAFLFDWNFEVYEVSTSDTGVSVRGKISGWFSEYSKYLSRPATGYQERNKKIDAQQAQKGATTDAIKKGLSLFGFNSDVYSGEV
jgi:hypothetical protein